jgi:hypothetical protein
MRALASFIRNWAGIDVPLVRLLDHPPDGAVSLRDEIERLTWDAARAANDADRVASIVSFARSLASLGCAADAMAAIDAALASDPGHAAAREVKAGLLVDAARH